MNSELQRWLDTATGVFPHATAARLRCELETHVEDTAEALRRAGHPQPEAAALHALGEAREVRRRLEETHFTVAEVHWVRQDSAMRRVLERGFYPDSWWRFLNVLALVFFLSVPLIGLKSGETFSWIRALIYWGFAVVIALIEAVR